MTATLISCPTASWPDPDSYRRERSRSCPDPAS